LRDVLIYKKEINPRFSARSWARKMGFANHSLLMFFLSGTRPVRLRHLQKVFRGLSISQAERSYIEALVQYEQSESESEREYFVTRLRQLAPEQKMVFLETEKARVISSWLHMAILEMTEVPGFTLDAKWIQSRLLQPISLQQIHRAIESLESLKLLQKKSDSISKVHQSLSLGGERASEAIREYHRGSIKLAYQAIEKQKMSERILQGFALAFDPTFLPEVQSSIDKFRRELELIASRSKPYEVYQCNIQFFNLTKIKKEQK
jgi:uncharacterized protein (TIGR02147 family)